MTTYPDVSPNLSIRLLQGEQINDWRLIDDALLDVDAAVAGGYQPAGDYLTTEGGDERYLPLAHAPGTDPHPQYATDADLAAHAADADGHGDFLTPAEADALFLTPAEGDAAYAAVGHTHPSEQSGPWRFQDTTTIANPAVGTMRVDTGVPSTASVLSFSRTTQDGYDIPPPGWGVQAGDTIYLQDRDDSTRWVRYTADEPLAQFATYATGAVTVVGSAGSIPHGTIVQVTFSLAGGGGGGGGAGALDYARLLVSTTAPPAPTAPSQAFWLNPTEAA